MKAPVKMMIVLKRSHQRYIVIYVTIIYCYHGNRSYHSNKQLQWILH